MRLAKRVLVFALAFLLLLGGIGISAALAAGAEREAAPQARAPFAGELAVIERGEIDLCEADVPLAPGPGAEDCCVLHLFLLILALLAALLWIWDDRLLRAREAALRAQLTERKI